MRELREALERLPTGEFVLQDSNSYRRIGTASPFYDGNVLRATVAHDGWPDLVPLAHLESIVTILNTLRRPGALELLALLDGPDDATVDRVARALRDSEAPHDNVKSWVQAARAALAAAKEVNGGQ